MSVKVMAAVWELDLAQTEKLVLLALADHADDVGRCWPSLVRVAWKSGLGHRQTQRVVRKLVEKKLLVAVAGKSGGRGSTIIYEVHAQKGVKLTPFDSYRRNFLSRKGGLRDADRATLEVEKGDMAVSPEPSLNRTTNQPSGNTQNESAGADVALSSSDRSARFMEIWNQNCGTLPKVREITKARQQKLQMHCRVRPDFEREFVAAVKKAAQTPFLLGESKRGWKANFDWLVRSDTNLIGILEGKYDSDRKENSKQGGRIQLSREESEAKYGNIKPTAVVH